MEKKTFCTNFVHFFTLSKLSRSVHIITIYILILSLLFYYLLFQSVYISRNHVRILLWFLRFRDLFLATTYICSSALKVVQHTTSIVSPVTSVDRIADLDFPVNEFFTPLRKTVYHL